jgi:hypothetical protein
MLPVVNVPSLLTVISCPELEAIVPVVAPLLRLKLRSLRSWATFPGFASKFVRVMDSVPAPVVNVAVASTSPPLVVLPDGVSNVTVSAWAVEAPIAPTNNNAPIHKDFVMFKKLP